VCYFSEILGKPLEDARGNHLGLLADLVATVQGENKYPILSAIAVAQQDRTILIPYIKGTLTSSPAIPIRLPNLDLEEYVSGQADVFLARDVLDKLLISADNTCVAQVSDLKFERQDGIQTVRAIDVGNLGFLRRCGLVKTAQAIAAHQGIGITDHMISWEAVQFDLSTHVIRLTIPMDPVTAKYNTWLAKILPGLNRYQRKQFIENLDENRLVDIFLQIEPEVQSSAALNLTDERLSKILMEMGPDEAVNLLARLSRNRAESILGRMDVDTARVLRKLLYYPHNTAGRIVTTAYLAIRGDQSVAQALTTLHESKDGKESGDAVYVTNANNQLIGITSLSELEIAKPTSAVTSLMNKRAISVRLLERVEDVALLILKYNLLSVPVVDENNILRGVVLAKDALAKNVPATWKKRQPKKHVHSVLS
jgi:magnesium transporter